MPPGADQYNYLKDNQGQIMEEYQVYQAVGLDQLIEQRKNGVNHYPLCKYTYTAKDINTDSQNPMRTLKSPPTDVVTLIKIKFSGLIKILPLTALTN